MHSTHLNGQDERMAKKKEREEGEGEEAAAAAAGRVQNVNSPMM